MDKMPSVTQLLDLAKSLDKSAHLGELKAKAYRDAAELVRDYASDEYHAARLMALINLVAAAARSGEE